MARVNRSALPDGYFHVLSRGVAGASIYADDDDRRAFVDLLRSCEHRLGWTCHAFCLMTTHYHLILECACAQLSRGLHRLNCRYALRFNMRHDRFGHLFAERFSARSIADESYLYDVAEYAVQNPVKAGLCDRAADWPWSYSRFGV